MRRTIAGVASLALIGIAAVAREPSRPAAVHGQRLPQQYVLPNPNIDYEGFLANAAAVSKLRQARRVSEQDFVEMIGEPDTIVLDARSDAKYRMLHVKGAMHLSLPDITAEELARVIPSKSTRVLIYCNNNFENEPEAFPTKAVRASLNLYTFNTLYSYGYTNVYELGPLIDIKASKLPFEGEKAGR